jgi:hypothetical protein
MTIKFTYKMRSGGKWDVGLGTHPTQTNLFKKIYIHIYHILVGFGRARARPCAVRTRLFELIATPNGTLRAPSYSTPKNI